MHPCCQKLPSLSCKEHKEGWALKNWCFWTVVLEKILENPLESKESKPVNLKRNQPWIFTWKDWCWRWSSNTLATWSKELTHWKRPWCWERLKAKGEGVAENEMVREHHWLNGHEFEQTLGDSEEQGSLACCSPWDGRVRHDWATEQQQLWTTFEDFLKSGCFVSSVVEWE